MHLLAAALVVLGSGSAGWTQENGPPLRRFESNLLRFDVENVYGANLKSGGAAFGPLRMATLGVDFLTPVAFRGRWQLDMGMEWRRREVDYSRNPGLPSALQIVSVPLVASFEVNEPSTLAIRIAPGIYSDMEDLGWSDVNAPIGIRFYHEYAHEVIWYAGLQADWMNEIPVMPDFGVRWRFWYDWILDVNLPNPRIEYEITDKWVGSAGVEWRGAAYRVSEVLPSSGGRPGTGDATLTYRDYRVKVGLRYQWDEESFFQLAGGYSLHRRLKFSDGNFQLTTGGAPFVQASFQAAW